MNKLFFEGKENPRGKLQVFPLDPSPSAFLTFVQKWDLFYKKLPHFRRRRIFAAVLINQSAIMELNKCRLIYSIFCKISFFLLSKLKRCGLRHHEFKDSLWVWQDFSFLSFWGATQRRIAITTICVIAILQLRFRMTMRCYHKWLLPIFTNSYSLIATLYFLFPNL